MLKFVFLLLLSFPALACLRVQGSFSVDGETWKIDQKMDMAMEYALPMGSFILSMTVNNDLVVKYKVEEKKGTSLTLVTRGEEKLKTDKANDIFAKGEEGQPNSIITLKVSKI